MKTFAFNDLPQLQALIFADEGGPGTPDLGKYGYRGVVVVIKLNNERMISLEELLSEEEKKEEQGKVRALSVEAKDAKAETIPVDAGISESRLHELVVRANCGHLLINLGLHR